MGVCLHGACSPLTHQARPWYPLKHQAQARRRCRAAPATVLSVQPNLQSGAPRRVRAGFTQAALHKLVRGETLGGLCRFGVDVKVLLHHVHSIQADVCGDEVGPGGAEGRVAVEAEQRNALGQDHRVRNHAVREFLHVVLRGLDEAKLDPEVGPVHTQLVGGVHGECVAADHHREVDHGDGGEGRHVGHVLRHRRDVKGEELQQGDGLVDEHVALEVAVGHILAVVVGGDVAGVMDKGGAEQEDLVIGEARDDGQDGEVGDVAVAKLLLELVHNLGPEDHIPCRKLVEGAVGVDSVEEEGAERAVVARRQIAQELTEGAGPLGVDDVVHLEHDAEVLVGLAVVLLDVVHLPVEVEGQHITVLSGDLGGHHGELGRDLFVGIQANNHPIARGKRYEVVGPVDVPRVKDLYVYVYLCMYVCTYVYVCMYVCICVTS